MTRSAARENLMQMLYQMEIQKDYSVEAKEQFIFRNIEDDDQIDYINSVFEAFVNNKNEIDSLIENNSKGWKLQRIAKVDLSILRLCLSEYKYLSSDIATPESAAINEAVKIAKKYSTEDAAKFINGILGQISRS